MKNLFILLTFLCIGVQAFAIPAKGVPTLVKQPDGTTLTIKLIGDEYYHFNTTADGYTIVKDDNGVFVYAQKVNDQLQPTTIKAHDQAARTASENAFLANAKKYITDRTQHKDGEARRVKRDAAPKKAALANMKNFRGLVLLINFTDKKFSMTNPREFYTDMLNTEGYSGYTLNGKTVSCPGSMCDYFNDCSMGKFKPKFDVLGPVNVNHNCEYPMGASVSRMSTIIKEAMSALNSTVDFSQYDSNNDGKIDMIYVLCAGMASSFEGNNSRWLWPHQSDYVSMGGTYDGKSLGRYACSTELYGWQDKPDGIDVEGIGTMCHEFSHSLGLPDLYDTDYEKGGGQSHDPDMWEPMASGTGFNVSRYPASYSLYDRLTLGWAAPKTITAEGDYTIANLVNTGEGLRIQSANSREFFLLENRQKKKWDLYLPGHGMIVARVDSSKTWGNDPNTNPARNYYELVRAGNTSTGSLGSDPFPGTKGVSMLGPSTTPPLATWDNKTTSVNLIKIKEANSVISFKALNTNSIQKLTEDFEKMPATTDKSATDVTGRFTNWDFAKCNVVAPGSAYCNGTHAVAMYSGTAITSNKPVYYNTYFAAAQAINTSTSAAKFTLSYSTNNGASWTRLKSMGNLDTQEVPSSTTKMLYWDLSFINSQPVLFRLNQTAGNKTVPVYIDDFSLFYTGSEGGKYEPGDVNADGLIDIRDLNILVNIVLGQDGASRYDGRADLNGDGKTDIVDVNIAINLILGL